MPGIIATPPPRTPGHAAKIKENECVQADGLVVCQFGEVLRPQPADEVLGIILVLGQP